MDAGHEGMTGRPTAFGMNCEMTSACCILFHAESQTKQNKPEAPRCLHYSVCPSKGPSSTRNPFARSSRIDFIFHSNCSSMSCKRLRGDAGLGIQSRSALKNADKGTFC